MSLLKIGEYVTSPPFRRVLIEACSLDNTSAPSRFKGHVEDTTNLASKSGSGLERGTPSIPTQETSIVERKELLGRFTALNTLLAAPLSMRKVVGFSSGTSWGSAFFFEVTPFPTVVTGDPFPGIGQWWWTSVGGIFVMGYHEGRWFFTFLIFYTSGHQQ